MYKKIKSAVMRSIALLRRPASFGRLTTKYRLDPQRMTNMASTIGRNFRRKATTDAAACLALLVLDVIAMVACVAYFVTHSRVWELLVWGCLVATWMIWLRKRERRTAIVRLATSIVTASRDAIRPSRDSAHNHSQLHGSHHYKYSYSSATMFHGICSCGWVSEKRMDDEPIEQEFREHVIKATGRARYYHAPAVCTNCSFRGLVKTFCGMRVSTGTCPHCDVYGYLRSQEWYDRERPRTIYEYEMPTGPGRRTYQR